MHAQTPPQHWTALESAVLTNLEQPALWAKDRDVAVITCASRHSAASPPLTELSSATGPHTEVLRGEAGLYGMSTENSV